MSKYNRAALVANAAKQLPRYTSRARAVMDALFMLGPKQEHAPADLLARVQLRRPDSDESLKTVNQALQTLDHSGRVTLAKSGGERRYRLSTTALALYLSMPPAEHVQPAATPEPVPTPEPAPAPVQTPAAAGAELRDTVCKRVLCACICEGEHSVTPEQVARHLGLPADGVAHALNEESLRSDSRLNTGTFGADLTRAYRPSYAGLAVALRAELSGGQS